MTHALQRFIHCKRQYRSALERLSRAEWRIDRFLLREEADGWLEDCRYWRRAHQEQLARRAA